MQCISDYNHTACANSNIFADITILYDNDFYICISALKFGEKFSAFLTRGEWLKTGPPSAALLTFLGTSNSSGN